MIIDALLQALASPTQRRELLQQLFADIALEVDERAKGESVVESTWLFSYLRTLSSLWLCVYCPLWKTLCRDELGNCCKVDKICRPEFEVFMSLTL